MTKEELTNGKYWLAITSYPYPGCDIYDIIKSDINPDNSDDFNNFIVPELCKVCSEEYGYIDYPDEESFDDESDYQEALDYWENLPEEISINIKPITSELIEKFGKDYCLWDKSEPDYDLTK